MQKQKSTKIPTSALNIYKKYLTIQKEGQSKDPSVSINDISKTLSIDTFNTEWLPFNIDSQNESTLCNKEADLSEMKNRNNRFNYDVRLINTQLKRNLDTKVIEKDCFKINEKCENNKLKELEGDTVHFASIRTSVDENMLNDLDKSKTEIMDQSFLQFQNEIRNYPQVPHDGITLNLDMSRQSSIIDLELSEVLVRINNL